MKTKLTEIKEMIFQLSIEDIKQLLERITETIATKDFIKLAETGFQKWNHLEEDIYNYVC